MVQLSRVERDLLLDSAIARTKPNSGRTLILDCRNKMMWEMPIKKVILSLSYFLSLVSHLKLKVRFKKAILDEELKGK